MREGNDIEPPPRGFVHVTENGRMITDNHQLELRDKLEKVLPHEPGADLVAAGHLFDAAFSPCPAFFGFAGAHQPRAV